MRRARSSGSPRAAREELSAQQTLLPATTAVSGDLPHAPKWLIYATMKYLGPGLVIEDDTFLGPLRDALAQDLGVWSGGLSHRTVWDRFARGLIREERRGAPSARLHRNLSIKRQHAQFVEDVACAGAREAWLREGEDSIAYTALQDVSGQAATLLMTLHELESLATLADGTLHRMFKAGQLIYQRS